jgi:hypothetical protein
MANTRAFVGFGDGPPWHGALVSLGVVASEPVEGAQPTRELSDVVGAAAEDMNCCVIFEIDRIDSSIQELINQTTDAAGPVTDIEQSLCDDPDARIRLLSERTPSSPARAEVAVDASLNLTSKGGRIVDRWVCANLRRL